jgi:hypothetical protein
VTSGGDGDPRSARNPHTASQTVRYGIVDRKYKDPLRRYMAKPFLHNVRDYDGRA